jgi:hypothetical protein
VSLTPLRLDLTDRSALDEARTRYRFTSAEARSASSSARV